MTGPFVSEEALLDLVYRGSMTGPFLTEEALLDLVFQRKHDWAFLFFLFFSQPSNIDSYCIGYQWFLVWGGMLQPVAAQQPLAALTDI